jgi:phage shock protein C
MYCTQCGARVADTARFCTVCGHPVGVAAQPFVPHPEPWKQTAPARRLRRIASQKKIAGVCAGFAEYFDTDVSLMRIIWIALVLMPPGIGIIAYLLAWIILPKE